VSFPGPFTPKERDPGTHCTMRLGGSQSRSGQRGEMTVLDPTETRNAIPLLSTPEPIVIPVPDGQCAVLGNLSRIPFIRA
jgi:hypothetical protein